ncbi:MAG: biotin--[Clostridia bacterium]|nr:biotin--[acetyl-CoA-carboxylase] ligase [Clostridia bacterium]
MKKINWNIEEFDALSSTNTALRQVADNEKEGKVYIARSQTSGKGTKGRSFVSRKGGLYMSLLLKPKAKGFSATGITALTAVAMSEAIQKVFGIAPHIKWVNDLILNSKKLGGILVEGKMNSSGFDWVIVGVGVNITEPEGGFDEEIKNIATALTKDFSEFKREELIQEFLNRFEKYYLEFEKGGYKSKYKALSVVLGKSVTVKTANGEVTGVAYDIDNENRLIVKSGCTEYVFSSGEVVKVEYGK